MHFIKQFVVCVLALVSIKAFGQTLLITDIDDTIKRSHVLNKMDAIGQSKKTDVSFVGMAELYRQIESLNPASGFKIYYVTNAPSGLMGSSHAKFLRHSLYPEGELVLRDKLSKKEHKYITITQILNEQKPQQVVFLGDNGEADSDTYARLVSEHPTIKFFTFIRMDYQTNAGKESGVTPKVDQREFTSAFEIALALYSEGLLDDPGVQKVFQSVTAPGSEINLKGLDKTAYLPTWVNCTSHSGKVPSVPPGLAEHKEYTQFLNSIKGRCITGRSLKF